MPKSKKPLRAPFIVFCPTGETPPVVMHDTHGAAHAVANIMAKKHPGREFLVMGRAGRGAVHVPDAPEAEVAQP